MGSLAVSYPGQCSQQANKDRAPTVIILQDRGRSLRFFRPHFLRMKEGAFREFLKQEIWKNVAPWQTSFSPGGEWYAFVPCIPSSHLV